MRHLTHQRAFTLWIISAAALLAACSNEGIEVVDPRENQAPQVWLSAAPPEGATDKYKIHLYWGGWDPDGEISHYEFLVTNNNNGGVFNPADTVGDPWTPVYANDSTFTFTADILLDSTTTRQDTEFTRSHTFFIRAIDEEGLRSSRPAYRSFTSRTLSPAVNILIPARILGTTPAEVPPITTFSWKASDFVSDRLAAQEPDSVQWALVSTVPFASAPRPLDAALAYLRSGSPASQKEWFPWVYYRADGDSGKFWTSPPLEFGTYIFAMRAKDEAGAVTPVLDEVTNVRRIRVSTRINGPFLTVSNLYMGATISAVCTPPITILDVPSGIQLLFNFSATAESYGGIVSGYRYGWDIADLDDPEQWEVDYTPFVGNTAQTAPRTFFFGTHTLTIEAIDNSGYCSRVEVKVNVVQFTLERNVLVVDDFRPDEVPTANPGFDNSIGRGVLPSDAEHDAFWVDMLSSVSSFDPVSDVLSLGGAGEVPLATLARYKTVIWITYSDVFMRDGYPLLYPFIQYRKQTTTQGSGLSGKVQPNYLALAMVAGMHIMIAGQHPIQLVEHRSYAPNVRHPIILRYELEGVQTGSGPDLSKPVGEESFGYKELCVDVIDYGFMDFSRRRYQPRPILYCPVNAYRKADANSLRDDTMREALPLDTNFPLLQLRPEVSDLGKAFQPEEKGLDAEVYNPDYFRIGKACRYVPSASRDCFQPIYGLGCFDTEEPTYNQPVAFWTSAFADHVADVPGAIGARSVVFGFPPVYFNPSQVEAAMEYILFNEWQLPRDATAAASASR